MAHTDRRIAHDLRELLWLAKKIHFLQEIQMSTTQNLIDKITELGNDVTSYEQREQATVDALTATVKDLQTKVDAGGTFDAAPEIASLQAIIDAIPSATPPTVPAT